MRPVSIQRALSSSLAFLAACSAPEPRSTVAEPLGDSPAASVALEYLDALRRFDWDRAAALTAEDLWYFDPTMEYFERPPIDHRDRASALEFYRSATEDSATSDVSWELVDGFEAGPWVVFELRVSVSGDGAFWDIDRDTVTIEGGRQVSAIRVEGGLVTDHIDLVAYGDAMVQLDALRERHGPAR